MLPKAVTVVTTVAAPDGGQYPQASLHLSLNSCFLQFISLSSSVFSVSLQNGGSSSLH